MCGVQRPEQVDLEKVKAALPVGNVTVKAVKGGSGGNRQRSYRSAN